MKNLNQDYKKIGIIGGLGPMATKDLFEWIIELTPAKIDQEHLPVIINNIPQIPDRTKYLLGEGVNPLPNLIKTALELEKMGAEIIAIPCNTAHVFLDEIQKKLKKARLVDMIFETKKFISSLQLDPDTKIGLLATTGTVKTNLYQSYFPKHQLITSTDEIQIRCVMEAIYGAKGIKAGYLTKRNEKLLTEALDSLVKNGADIIILGCTEISLALRKKSNKEKNLINPIKILAKELDSQSIYNNLHLLKPDDIIPYNKKIGETYV